jgi:hypothetical protein
MLMAAYSTVITTMWSIRYVDAPLVVQDVYAGLTEGGIADSRGAAKALHMAPAHLRSKIGEKEFARWIPYIHIGI